MFIRIPILRTVPHRFSVVIVSTAAAARIILRHSEGRSYIEGKGWCNAANHHERAWGIKLWPYTYNGPAYYLFLYISYIWFLLSMVTLVFSLCNVCIYRICLDIYMCALEEDTSILNAWCYVLQLSIAPYWFKNKRNELWPTKIFKPEIVFPLTLLTDMPLQFLVLVVYLKPCKQSLNCAPSKKVPEQKLPLGSWDYVYVHKRTQMTVGYNVQFNRSSWCLIILPVADMHTNEGG